jgi:ATP-dependent Clp protease ATP-binding subunit ClpC
MLTEALRKQPNAVVLFDEIEKADPTLHNLLLQVLDEGRLTDGRGQTVSLRQAVIVMTSNIGAAEVRALENRAGFATGGASAPVCATRHAATMRALEDSFAPEFLNRLDDVLVFRPLSVDDAEAIVDRLIAQFRGRLRRLGYRLRVSAEARRAVAQRGWSHTYGAREIARALQRLVEDPIAERIVNDDAAAVTRFFLHVADGEVRVRSAA